MNSIVWSVARQPIDVIAITWEETTLEFDGTWTKKLVVVVWPDGARTVSVLFPEVASLATARSKTRLASLEDLTVGVMPVGALTVAPLNPAPLIVTDGVVADITPLDGEIPSIRGATLLFPPPLKLHVSAGW